MQVLRFEKAVLREKDYILKEGLTMQNHRAFTLIELLIVVAIIAILAAIAVPNFLEAQIRSKIARVKSDTRTVATAMESYAVDNNRYPYCAPGLDHSYLSDI